MRVVTPGGNPPFVWQPLIDSAPHLSVGELTERRGRLVVLGARPDDETIGAGRLITTWAREFVAAPWRFDPHPDHAPLGAAATEACAAKQVPLLEYPIWSAFWQQPSAPEEAGYQVVRVDTDRRGTEARARAPTCYSQPNPSRCGRISPPVVPASILEHHQQILFHRNNSHSPAGTRTGHRTQDRGIR